MKDWKPEVVVAMTVATTVASMVFTYVILQIVRDRPGGFLVAVLVGAITGWCSGMIWVTYDRRRNRED